MERVTVQFAHETANTESNYWFKTLITENEHWCDDWVGQTNKLGVMARPVWTLMHQLKMNKDALFADISNTKYFFERLINALSSTCKQ